MRDDTKMLAKYLYWEIDGLNSDGSEYMDWTAGYQEGRMRMLLEMINGLEGLSGMSEYVLRTDYLGFCSGTNRARLCRWEVSADGESATLAEVSREEFGL